MVRTPLAVLALALLAASPGCASERHLVVLSDPPGATVRLDNEVVGVTPLDHPFAHFGDRRLTLYLDGYRGQSRALELRPPWYARFPVDLLTELLIPVGYRYVQVERFELDPEVPTVSLPDLEETLRRAESLRRGGLTGPRPMPLEEIGPVEVGTPSGASSSPDGARQP
jgi:hypothetical protein